MKIDNAEKIFKALGNETRLEILILLKDKRLCVNALVADLKVSQPSVSQHLSVLKNAGLIEGEKIKNKVHYSLKYERLKLVVSFLNEFLNQ